MLSIGFYLVVCNWTKLNFPSADVDASSDTTSQLTIFLDKTTAALAMKPDVEKLMTIHKVTDDMVEGKAKEETKTGCIN